MFAVARGWDPDADIALMAGWLVLLLVAAFLMLVLAWALTRD